MKKVLFIRALALGLMSFSTASDKTIVAVDDCFDVATNVMHQSQNAGHTEEETTWYMQAAYALCMG